ncbi:hypothetical protein AAC387_Pa01g1404 [Persea americana]
MSWLLFLTFLSEEKKNLCFSSFFSFSVSTSGIFSARWCVRTGLNCTESHFKMQGEPFLGLGNRTQAEGKVLQTFQKSFVEVQSILDQNRLLISEINQNHESKIPHNLTRNIFLIQELNNNIRRVVGLYADLSSSFTKSMESSSDGDSAGTLKFNGKPGQKRIRRG